MKGTIFGFGESLKKLRGMRSQREMASLIHCPQQSYSEWERGKKLPNVYVLYMICNTFHSWRHTFRTRLAEAGVPDDVAKRLGGWTEDSTALRYDHDGRVEELRKAVEATIEQPKTRNQ